MRIKKVTPQDLNKIYQLEKEVFGQDAFSRSLIQKLMRRSDIFIKFEKKWIKKSLIGFAIAVKDRLDRVNIINFLINPKFQRKGYGKAMMEKIISSVKNMEDIKQIVLNVKVNNKAAIQLYEKFHFKIVKIIEDYYKSGDSGFLMVLDLNT